CRCVYGRTADHATVPAEHPERPVVAVQVVLEHEVAREARACELRLVPLTIGLLRCDKICDAAAHAVAVRFVRRQQRKQRPCGLRRGALADTTKRGIVVRRTALAPTTVGVLVIDEPAHRATDPRLLRILAGSDERR